MRKTNDHLRAFNFITKPLEERSVKLEVDLSDLQKLESILHESYMYHLHKDEMTARAHLAKKVFTSPLTTELKNAWERLTKIMSKEYIGTFE